MTDELKPVRCGCGAATRRCADPITGQWFVQCRACGTVALYYNSEAEAVEAWNKAMGAKDINVPDKERKKGEWIEENRRPKSGAFYCSVCHRTAYDPQPTRLEGWKKKCRYAFCPNCGAEMRGE